MITETLTIPADGNSGITIAEAVVIFNEAGFLDLEAQGTPDESLDVVQDHDGEFLFRGDRVPVGERITFVHNPPD